MKGVAKNYVYVNVNPMHFIEFAAKNKRQPKLPEASS